MCDKHSKTIIEVLKQNKVYIVKYIAKNFNEFVLISTVHTSHSEIAFSVAVSDVSSHDNMINSSDVDTALLNKKIKIYRL